MSSSPIQIDESWREVLGDEFEKPYFQELRQFLVSEIQAGQVIYPPLKQIFSAFDACRFDQVKVVILGQDPYHGPGQAHGMCFSVNEGVAFPPSLLNIFKEIHSDLGKEIPKSGFLERWAVQGVLLLNASLTVRAHSANSHSGKGWERFTDRVIQELNDQKEGIVFMLWGRYAQNKGAIIDTDKHYVLNAAHPSPLSAHSGFFGCKHFSQANMLLDLAGKEGIKW